MWREDKSSIISSKLMRRYTLSKETNMIIQLDLTKAYDKLSWAYIRAILKAYGFDQNGKIG